MIDRRTGKCGISPPYAHCLGSCAVYSVRSGPFRSLILTPIYIISSSSFRSSSIVKPIEMSFLHKEHVLICRYELFRSGLQDPLASRASMYKYLVPFHVRCSCGICILRISRICAASNTIRKATFGATTFLLSPSPTEGTAPDPNFMRVSQCLHAERSSQEPALYTGNAPAAGLLLSSESKQCGGDIFFQSTLQF
jgi:hypothetical protein